ncbi:DUF397 domain-containing protein [Nocardiopsis sp. LOL_012]|uniref:DUF397 domain-containing protein n=1 Tax=Nocardiopsis sp. LOL_012 TaxID=3345409 RepID=UPI003A869593
MTEERVWHKASYSSGSGSCVEVSEGADALVRDTQNRDLGHLSAPAQEWVALLAAVRVQ